ncbi:hypothetical protein CBL_05650 [Carabus blaptoides fortunei]
MSHIRLKRETAPRARNTSVTATAKGTNTWTPVRTEEQNRDKRVKREQHAQIETEQAAGWNEASELLPSRMFSGRITALAHIDPSSRCESFQNSLALDALLVVQCSWVELINQRK